MKRATTAVMVDERERGKKKVYSLATKKKKILASKAVRAMVKKCYDRAGSIEGANLAR